MKIKTATGLSAVILAFAAAQAQAQFPGRGPALPEIPLEDLPYTNNIAKNPSFEKGLEENPLEGWVLRAVNGGDAKCAFLPANSTIKPFDGKKALHLRCKSPVKFSPKIAADPDWGAFIHGANGGKGAATASVTQRFPVVPGKLYAMRFRYVGGEDFSKMEINPGPDRGYCRLTVKANWIPEKGKKFETAQTGIILQSPSPAAQISKPTTEWTTWAMPVIPSPTEVAAAAEKAKAQKKPYKPPTPKFLKAPENAAFATVTISLECLKEKVKPEVFVDKFEFAEVTLPQNPAAAAAAAAAAAK